MPGIDKAKLDKYRSGEIKFVQIFNINAQQVASLLIVGHNFYSQGRLNEAQAIFEGLAVLDATNPYLHNILGAIFQRKKEYNKALLRYTLAIELLPDDIDAFANRGEVYLAIGKFLEASNDFKKAIELDADGREPSANRARMLATLAAERLASLTAAQVAN
ncbi:MAG TPA: type III secretion protein [Acidobacteriota bacterium]|nr:type III secretion protein [Acidobacteriota bacterium]